MKAATKHGQPLKGTVTLRNTRVYPFNDSQMTVVLDTALESRDYHVNVMVTDARGEAGEIIVSGKATNGFKLAYTGSAAQVVVDYAVTGVTALAKNYGHISWTDTGSLLCFGNGALTVDVARCQRGCPVAVDISADKTGALVLGLAHQYVAKIDIPAKTYAITAGPADDVGFPKLKKTADTLPLDKVMLTLWPCEVLR